MTKLMEAVRYHLRNATNHNTGESLHNTSREFTHGHLAMFIFMFGSPCSLACALSGLPIGLAVFAPGKIMTRQIIAVSQMLWSAFLIHLTEGRIETHFHVFGSLAFLAFYKDWRVIATATVVVSADHALPGAYLPLSGYGIPAAPWWRFLEHAGWVVFEDVVLLLSIRQSIAEMLSGAMHQAEIEESRSRTWNIQSASARPNSIPSTRRFRRRPPKPVKARKNSAIS